MVKHASDRPSESSDSKYKGVRKRKWGKWVSEIRLPNSRERIWLGSYDSAEKAARAFDAAMYCLRGRTAKFNFPDNPPEIEGGRSLTPSEIQVAAARFANSEAPPTTAEPRRTQSENTTSSTEDNSEQQVESPCASVISDGTGQLDSNELMWDGPFLDQLAGANIGASTSTSANYAADYGIFPGFDDLHNDYFTPSTGNPNVDYAEENLDGGFAQGSFLWNF